MTGFFRVFADAIRTRPWLFFLIVIVLHILLHLHVFNRDLVGVHVWRQTQTQINIENFAYNDFNILNTKSYSLFHKDFLHRYEFPVMQWIFACFYKLFGDHIIISRLLTFIIGIFSITGMYRLLGVLFNSTIARFAGTWAFCFSPVFYYYIVNPLPDNAALCTGIWSLYYFFSHLNKPARGKMLLSFLFLLLATLCKLPFIIYGLPWIVYFIRLFKREQLTAIFLKTLLFLLFLFPAALWYLWVISGWKGNGILKGIADTEHTSIGEILYLLQSNIVSMLPEMLINYGALVFFLAGLFVVFRYKLFKTEKGVYLAITGLAVCLYFIFELNMIGTIHDYYMFPFLPFLFILVAYGCKVLMGLRYGFVRGFAVFCLTILPLTAFLRINQRWNTYEPGFNKDLLVFKKELRESVPDNAYCIIGNDRSTHIWNYYLHKKSWSFMDNNLSEENFNEWCRNGAAYLFSDSREVEEKPYIRPRLKRLVMEKGSIRVYEIAR